MSNLAALLRQGEFVVTAELNPPKSASGAAVKRRAGVLKGSVDAINVTDSNRSVVAMAAFPMALHGRAGVGAGVHHLSRRQADGLGLRQIRRLLVDFDVATKQRHAGIPASLAPSKGERD